MKPKSSEGKLELNYSLFHTPSSPGINTQQWSQKVLGLWGGREGGLYRVLALGWAPWALHIVVS